MNTNLGQWQKEWWTSPISKPWYRYPYVYDYVAAPSHVHLHPTVDRFVVRCSDIVPIYHPLSLSDIAATTYVRNIVRKIRYPTRKQKMLVRLRSSLLSSHPMMTRARLRERGLLPRQCEEAIRRAAGPGFKGRPYTLTFQRLATSGSTP